MRGNPVRVVDPTGLLTLPLPGPLTPIPPVSWPLLPGAVAGSTFGTLGAWGACFTAAAVVGWETGDWLVENTDIEDSVAEILVSIGQHDDGFSSDFLTGCFVGGTFLALSTQLVPIESVSEDDEVFCQDPSIGDIRQARISKVRRARTNELIHITVAKETVTCTREHPFWVEGRGWLKAGQLKQGDLLRCMSGTSVRIIEISREIFTDPVVVYNLTVEGDHTYFVGKSSILVHNKWY